MICLSCGEHEATCDEECAHCYAEFLLANPSEYDPAQTTPSGALLYSLPGFREAKALVERRETVAA